MNFKITIFGFLSLMTLPTLSQSGINQQQTNFIGSNAYLLAFDQPGQSFTVSVSSKITKIEVLMDCGSSFGCIGQTAYLDLYNANNDNTPNGSPIVSGVPNTQFSGADSNPVWSVYNITSLPNVTNGNKYTFTVSGVPFSSDYGVLISGSDSYANGGPIRRNADTSGAWTIQTGKDIAFKVWVENNLGIEELIYAKDYFITTSNIELRVKSFNDQSFMIFDIAGKMIQSFAVLANIDYIISLENFSAGIYILKSKTTSSKFLVN